MTIELKTDGTYQASAWLSKGTYHLIDNGVVVLEDKEGKKEKNSSCKRKWVCQSCT